MSDETEIRKPEGIGTEERSRDLPEEEPGVIEEDSSGEIIEEEGLVEDHKEIKEGLNLNEILLFLLICLLFAAGIAIILKEFGVI